MNGNVIACRMLFSLRVCSTCFSFITCNDISIVVVVVVVVLLLLLLLFVVVVVVVVVELIDLLTTSICYKLLFAVL